jgi:hypothetical protein
MVETPDLGSALIRLGSAGELRRLDVETDSTILRSPISSTVQISYDEGDEPPLTAAFLDYAAGRTNLVG